VTATQAKLSRQEIADIYVQYGHLMLRRCRAITRSDALADDALQESFVNLIRYGTAFRKATAKLRWLYRLCDRCCFAQLKKRKRIVPMEAPERIRAQTTEMNTRLEDRDLVLRMLAQLEPKEQEIAVLFYLDGMSQGEIGKLLEWSRQTINKKLGKIQLKLDDYKASLEAER